MMTLVDSLNQNQHGLTLRQIRGILGGDILPMEVHVFANDNATVNCASFNEIYTVILGKFSRQVFPADKTLRIVCRGDGTHYLTRSQEEVTQVKESCQSNAATWRITSIKSVKQNLKLVEPPACVLASHILRYKDLPLVSRRHFRHRRTPLP